LAQRAPQLPFFLVIVGHGVLEAELRALIVELGVGDRVRMFGRLAPEPLAACYRCADVFVLPTTQIEGFGLATVEALASGIPVLGTPVGGTVEILQGIDSRLLFADVSPEAMADKIETFLRDPSPFLRLKPQCRETAVALYGWESVVDRIERELAWALSPRRDGG
jgi:glycosyltransferase involved in cell wall biosynthesis